MSDYVINKDSIENALDFYMLANQLKYISDDYNESDADHIYGAMVLATAINSEYKIVENVGKDYLTEIYDYFFASSGGGYLANICVALESELSLFFNQYLVEKQIKTTNIDSLYYVAKTHGIFDRIGNDKRNQEIFKFYYLNLVLKKKIRSGWDENHWNINYERVERISEHVVGTIALAMALNLEFDFNINLDQVVSTLCNHEIGEIDIGDITPFDGITPEQKRDIEHKAMERIIGKLSNKEEMLRYLFAFDDEQTEDAKFAHYCDKLEADIQAKVYQDKGYHHPLNKQDNNVVFKNPKVLQMIKDGAETAFDIWYEYDKSIYQNSPVFTKVLDYVKTNKIMK